jgi:hypothetical protein
MGSVALGMAERGNGAHAGDQLGLAIDRLDVLPIRQCRLHALSESPTRLGDRFGRLGPPLQLGGRDDDFGLWEHLRIGIFRHQAGDVIAVEVRDNDGLHVLRIETSRGHALRQDACLRPAGLSASGT